MTIAIIGTGNVGNALAKGLKGTGHDVVSAGNDPDEIRMIRQLQVSTLRGFVSAATDPCMERDWAEFLGKRSNEGAGRVGRTPIENVEGPRSG